MESERRTAVVRKTEMEAIGINIVESERRTATARKAEMKAVTQVSAILCKNIGVET